MIAPSFLRRANLTFPNEPDPKITSTEKSLSLSIFLFFLRSPSIITIENNIESSNQLKYNLFLLTQFTTKMTHSGYQKDRFVNLSFEQFDCIICSEVAMDPLECESCGRLFCKICINDWISKNPITKCPNRCTSNIVPVKSKALLRTYSMLQIRCSNAKCNKILKLGDLKAHEEDCLKIKCWNYAVCGKPENQQMKLKVPTCSNLCKTVYELGQNSTNQKKMYQILNYFLGQKAGSNQNVSVSSPLSYSTSGNNSSNVNSGSTSALTWDNSSYGTGIIVNEDKSSVFLKEQAYVFRTVVANIGFNSGMHYWEIHADNRTQNEIKVGVTSSKSFDFNSAFCDHPFGWAYYGLGQLRHGSNATGPAYGKRFKKQGVLGIFLNMVNGTLSFSLNGENMGIAYQDEKLKTGTYYPAVSLLHCAGCTIKSAPIPAWFNV